MTTQVLQGPQIFSVCLQDRGRDSSLSFYQDAPGLGRTTTTRSRCSADAVTAGTRWSSSPARPGRHRVKGTDQWRNRPGQKGFLAQ
jgi:hypothetical protein